MGFKTMAVESCGSIAAGSMLFQASDLYYLKLHWFAGAWSRTCLVEGHDRISALGPFLPKEPNDLYARNISSSKRTRQIMFQELALHQKPYCPPNPKP